MAAFRLGKNYPPFSTSFWLDTVLKNNRSLFLRQSLYCSHQLCKESSSSASKLPRRNGNGRSEGRMNHVKKLLRRFVSGSKELGSDVKRLLAIRRKLKDSGKNWDALSLDETIHMNQVQRDLAKTLPALLVFCIPFIGYAAPVIAFMFPKHLLSHHYWLPVQEEAFHKQETNRRHRHYLPLVRELGRYALQEKSKGSHYDDLLDVSVKTINKEHPSNEELLKSSAMFSEHEKLGFDELPKYHLKRLSQAWLIWPWLPKRVLRGNLSRRLAKIRKEDMALKREGLDNLEEQQVRRLCHRRGLDVSGLSQEALKKWLTEWIELSSAATAQDDSFLAHIAVYKTMNYHRDPADLTT